MDVMASARLIVQNILLTITRNIFYIQLRNFVLFRIYKLIASDLNISIK